MNKSRYEDKLGGSYPPSFTDTDMVIGYNGVNYGRYGIYYGQNLYGQMHGYGTFTGANGRVYVGEWNNDTKHGQGTQTNPDGTIFHSGEWVNDEPKK